MSKKDRVLTIDLGTSGPKVSIYDFELGLVASAFRDVPLILVEGGGVEQDPSVWTGSIESCIDELRLGHSADLARVRAVNVTSHWSGTVALGSEGKPLMNGIIWMDGRGAPQAARLTDGLLKVDGYGLASVLNWIRITGGCPTKSGKDSIAHILYLRDCKPEIYKKAEVFLEPKDYLNYYLTGRRVSSYDSIAVHWVTDNRDINRIEYSDSLIRKCGIDREKLPELVPVNSSIGRVTPGIAQRFGIPEDAEVLAGTPDLHSAAVGSGGVMDFTPHLYIGTSSWIVCHVPMKKADMFHNIASIPSAIPGRYMMANEQQTSGAALNFLKNKILFPGANVSFKELDERASRIAAGSDDLFFLPWLNGERSPFDVNHVRGGFINMGLKHGQDHMIRAVMEGVAMNLGWLKGYTESYCGRKFESIRFIGGGAHSAVWSQILADALGAPIDQMKDPLTANSKGTAALALVAIGAMDWAEVATKIEIKKRFEPDPAHRELFEKKSRMFVKFFERNSGWFRTLNAGGAYAGT